MTTEILRFENGTDALSTKHGVINRGETFGNDYRELTVTGFTSDHNLCAKNLIGEEEIVTPEELLELGRLDD